jgi:GAF domain-containing protein
MEEHLDPLAESMHKLSSFFVGDTTMAETLTRVAELARDSAPAVEYVGLTMMVNDRPSTAVFTDQESPEVDQAQYSSGRGPCLESFETGERRLIGSTRTDTRWPEFAHACLEHGILSTLSLPLTRGNEHLGAMNMYSLQEHAFDSAVIESVSMFAEQASLVVANAAAYWGARLTSEQLTESIESRAVIEQAKGIIMSSMRCTADEAFGHLTKQSQHMNIKVRDIAQQIVNDIGRQRNGESARSTETKGG